MLFEGHMTSTLGSLHSRYCQGKIPKTVFIFQELLVDMAAYTEKTIMDFWGNWFHLPLSKLAWKGSYTFSRVHTFSLTFLVKSDAFIHDKGRKRQTFPRL